MVKKKMSEFITVKKLHIKYWFYKHMYMKAVYWYYRNITKPIAKRHCAYCHKKIKKENRDYLEGDYVCKECFEEIVHSMPDDHDNCTPYGAFEDLDGILREHYLCNHVDDDSYTLLDW